MTTNKKAAPAGTGTASRTALPARNSTETLFCSLANLSTTATCIISLAAPMAAALSGLIAGGRL